MVVMLDVIKQTAETPAIVSPATGLNTPMIPTRGNNIMTLSITGLPLSIFVSPLVSLDVVGFTLGSSLGDVSCGIEVGFDGGGGGGGDEDDIHRMEFPTGRNDIHRMEFPVGNENNLYDIEFHVNPYDDKGLTFAFMVEVAVGAMVPTRVTTTRMDGRIFNMVKCCGRCCSGM